MFRPHLLAALALLFVTSAMDGRADPPTVSTETFDQAFRRELAEAGIPGGAYVQVVDGKVVQAVGVGVREARGDAPVSADTVFRIASVSKTFAAQLSAMLVDEGKLHWDDPLVGFAPEFHLKHDAQTRRLQLKHLLGQSTGLVPNAYDNLLDANEPLARILPMFRQLEPVCAPGDCYGYQNILFGLVAPALEQASGQSYADLLQQRLFTPLGMRQSSVGMDAFLAAPDKALPHVRRDGVWQPVAVESGYYQLPAAAGVNASANDLGRWLLAQMGSQPARVTPAQVAELTRKRVFTPKDMRKRAWRDLLGAAHYGLGWRIYTIGDDDIVLHGGWVKGYVADISYSPRLRSGLVVLLNAESNVINDITARFWQTELATHPLPPTPLHNTPKQAARSDRGVGAR
jgi:beta-lactamase class C